MVIGDLLETAARKLEESGTGDSYNEALVLLTFALDCNRTYIYVNRDREVDNEKANEYFEYIKRRSEGEPAAYIAGKAWFMSLEFTVNPSVLIPRPETERLVEEAFSIIEGEYSGKAVILDLCTGSGCIGISIADEFPDVDVCLLDIDSDALELASLNIKKHALARRVRTMKSDLFNSLGEEKFDLILSNPPYVAEGDTKFLSDEVRDYEPSLALFAGHDGYKFYKKIAAEARKYLNENGYLLLEAGIGQAAEIADLLKHKGFSINRICNDFSGIPRVVVAQKV